MGIISSAAFSGMGTGLAQLGGMMQRENERDEARADKLAFERERLAQAKELALERVRATAGGGGGGKGDPMAAKIAGGTDLASTFGFEMTPARESDFQTKVGQTKVQDQVSTDGGQYTDAISRRGGIIQDVMGTDKQAMQRSEADRTQRNIDRTIQLTDPGQFKSQQEGVQQQVVSHLAKAYERTSDPAARKALLEQMAEVTNATGTGERFKVEGDTRLNKGTGNMATTELGKAKAAEHYAKGNAEGVKAKDETMKALTQERVAVTTSLREASGDLQKLRAQTKDVSSKNMAAHEQAIADAVALVNRYREQADELTTRLGDLTRGKKAEKSPAGIKDVKDNPTAPAAPAAPAASMPPSRASLFKVIR